MRVILVTIVCLLAIGCNADRHCRRESALLRAEFLDLEDKYYLLKSNHEMAVSELNGLKGISGETFYDGEIIYESELLDGSLSFAEDTSQFVDMPGKQGAKQVRFENQSVIQNSGRPIPALDDLQVNVSGVRSRQSGVFESTPELNAPANNPVQSNSILNRPTLEISHAEPLVNAEITEVLIHRLATRGHDVDGKPGDEGMDLWIQPRTADGRVEFQTGELTVSVIDPVEPPDRQRIGLWKLLPGETELFFANDELGNRGILLHLPWVKRAPVHQRLIIHVRFITRDGQTLTTSTDIRITPPAADYSPDDPLVSRWTKRDSRWISDQAGQRTNSRPAQTAIKKPSWRPVR